MQYIKIFLALIIGASTLLFSISSQAGETDDTSLFVEAFSAHNSKDYLLAIDKIASLNKMFPDTPLRDVTLLLLARSAIKAGDNNLAAKTISQFNTEFSTSPLATTIEDDLQMLAVRLAKGETIKPNRQLRLAAEKIRNEQLALQRAQEQKREQERMAQEKAEQERIARAKAEEKRKELERIAAEKADKESIKSSITFAESGHVVISGQQGQIGFTLINHSKKRESFTLQAIAPSDYRAAIHAAEGSGKPISSIALEPLQSFAGVIRFVMPSDKVDGHKSKISLHSISSRYADIKQSSEIQLIAAASLIRVVAKTAKPVLEPGEQARYKVTVLNIGSQPAKRQSIRVMLPQNLEFIDVVGSSYRQESPGIFVFMLESLETGKLAEFNFNVAVKKDSLLGQKIQGTVEIIDAFSQQKQIFKSVVSLIQKNKK